MPADSVIRRPGGRSERNRAAVHAAVIELITEDGLDAVTVPAVAARAGVHYSSIYRRWGTVPELLFDVILEGATREVPNADTGSLRGDLLHFAQDARRIVDSPVGTALIQTLFSLPLDDGGSGRRTYWTRRRATLKPIFDQARARGEVVPEIEDVIEAVVAPLYFRRFISARPIDDAFLETLVDRVLAEHAPQG